MYLKYIQFLCAFLRGLVTFISISKNYSKNYINFEHGVPWSHFNLIDT
jgi:hypothetical protein